MEFVITISDVEQCVATVIEYGPVSRRRMQVELDEQNILNKQFTISTCFNHF